MNKDIEKILEKVSEDSTGIIVNPETLDELKRSGIPFQTIPAPTIDQLFEQRKQACLRLPGLPALPSGLPPAIQALYQEIRECIFFGLNGAAITLSSILIEFVLKYTTFVKEAGGHEHVDPQNWDQFEEIELYAAIGRAEKAGLLEKKMVERLHSFRKKIRNLYNHYNIKKITEHVVAQRVKQVNVETGEIREMDIKAKDSPMIQAYVKPIVDKHNVMQVFAFADEVVKYLLPKIGCK